MFAAEEEHGGDYDGEYLGVEVQKIVKGKQADDQNLNPNNKTKIMVGDLLVAVVSINTISEGRACIRVIWKALVVEIFNFYSFSLPSNLFHCYCHVSSSILKQPKQVFF